MIRLFLADDHAVLRRGLQMMLESTREMTVVGSASDGHELLNSAALASAEILILDLNMPRLGGVEALRRLRQRLPELKVIVLSMYPEDQHGLAMVKEGASAYLSKQRPPEELLAAIRRVHQGGTYLTETLTAQVLGRPGSSSTTDAPHTQLSQREHQIFLLLLEGRSASEVAAELDLHASTVSNNIRRIKDKLGVNTVGEIVSYAHRHGLCE